MKTDKKDKSNSHLKIAMLGHKTVPAMDSSRGGIEVVVEELAPRLVEMGCEVTCYNRTGCDNGGLSEYKGVKLKPVPTFKRKGLAAMTSSFFAAVKVMFGHYDVIHFHAEGPCFWMWVPVIFCKERCVATIHGVVGISSTSKNSYFCGNDTHSGLGYRFGILKGATT
ncbi:MAG: glycosyltransferase family 4 protein [Clostridiales bacterium]|nr:glycosyltransferase family 4 protein [Clostridiales bacterium]